MSSRSHSRMNASSYAPPHVPVLMKFVPEKSVTSRKTHPAATTKPGKKPSPTRSASTHITQDLLNPTGTSAPRNIALSVKEEVQPMAPTIGTWGSKTPIISYPGNPLAAGVSPSDKPQLPTRKPRQLRRYEVPSLGRPEEHQPDPVTVRHSKVLLKDHLRNGGLCDHSAMFGGMVRYNSWYSVDKMNLHRLRSTEDGPDVLEYKYARETTPELQVSSDFPLKPFLTPGSASNRDRPVLGAASKDLLQETKAILAASKLRAMAEDSPSLPALQTLKAELLDPRWQTTAETSSLRHRKSIAAVDQSSMANTCGRRSQLAERLAAQRSNDRQLRSCSVSPSKMALVRMRKNVNTGSINNRTADERHSRATKITDSQPRSPSCLETELMRLRQMFDDGH